MDARKDKQSPETSHIDYLLYAIAGSAVFSVGFSLLLWLKG